MAKEDFYQSKPFTSRLGPDTLERLKSHCKKNGITLWRYLDLIVQAALDKAQKEGL
jgi:hypothetical protein